MGLYVICRSISDILDVFSGYFGPGYDWSMLYAKYGVVDRRPKSIKRLMSNGLAGLEEDFS